MLTLFFWSIFGISRDCSALISFASDLGLNSSARFNFPLLSSEDCCNSLDDVVYRNGIKCTNLRVTAINWGGDRQLVSGFINASALNLLTALESLQLLFNHIGGNPPSTFPSSLTLLNLGYTHISGPLISFPPNIEYFHADGSYMSGPLPDIPDSLYNFRADGLWFSGMVHMKTAITLELPRTQISRLFIDDFSQLSLAAPKDEYGFCDISITQLYQTQVAYLADFCFMSGIRTNTECGVVSNIAQDLGMPKINNAAYMSLNGSCCTGVGIKCDTNLHIIDTNWSGIGLNGTLDTTKIELQYSYSQSFNNSNNQISGSISNKFTSNVVTLDLSNNKLNGKVGKIRFNKLTTLNLANNQFSGSLDILPPILINLNISNNAINGTIPRIPLSLKSIDISYNAISSSISLNAPVVVNIKSNSITEVVFNLTDHLAYCNLEENSLINKIYPAICSAEFTPILLYGSSTAAYTELLVFPTSTLIVNPTFDTEEASFPWLIIVLVTSLIILCILVFVASIIFKHPVMHSKFGRKNSFGTLNTVATSTF